MKYSLSSFLLPLILVATAKELPFQQLRLPLHFFSAAPGSICGPCRDRIQIFCKEDCGAHRLDVRTISG